MAADREPDRDASRNPHHESGAHPGGNPGHHGPFTLNEVLAHELGALRPGHFAALKGTGFPADAPPRANEAARSRNLKEIYHRVGALPDDEALSALCLSGGGIRSATFNLGVIQGLARAGLLGRFDYLSTVSGGGYIGSWLKAWMRRDGTAEVLRQLAAEPTMPLKPEPRPVDRLRENSNYLTPRRGLGSGDTWAAVAIIVRNIILNWFVVVPVLICVVAVPLVFAVLLAGDAGAGGGAALRALALSLALAVAAATAVHYEQHHAIGAPDGGGDSVTARILVRGLVPLVAATAALCVGVVRLDGDTGLATVALIAGLWAIAAPVVGWLIAGMLQPERAAPARRLAEFKALTASGVVAAGILTWVLATVVSVTTAAEDAVAVVVGPVVRAAPGVPPTLVAVAVLGVPVLFAIYLFARALFIAVLDWATPASWAPGVDPSVSGVLEDADREWWARFSGYVLMTLLGWLALAGLALYGSTLASHLLNQYALPALAAAGGASAITAALIGMGGDTHVEPGRPAPRLKTWLMRAAGPLICLSFVPLFAVAFAALVARLQQVDAAGFGSPVVAALTVVAALLAVSWVAGHLVNVNRFSLNGFYRNRLVRAYLGASNTKRRPNPFTGFAPDDNMKLATLWHPGDPFAEGDVNDADAVECTKPLHVVNTTLNLVRGERLAWQERKSESFSMTPFFCGNFYEGYRRTDEYGGRGGITLGTAVAISGAAANPNMGYHSSPAVTFLLTLLNGRLGAWLGNTNRHGDDTFRRSAPGWAVRPMLDELTGGTRADAPYIQLSDGGHFENLGVYEMVLRRCRTIVACDASCDPTAGFTDLGNMIRKVRIDFGVSIEFGEPIRIPARSATEPGLACALGTIRYSQADGPGAPDGTLLYIKPTLGLRDAAVPYDVYSYARSSDAFPHEPTSDQWFSESQFESYRALGEHAVTTIAGARAVRQGGMTLGGLLDAVRGRAVSEPVPSR